MNRNVESNTPYLPHLNYGDIAAKAQQASERYGELFAEPGGVSQTGKTLQGYYAPIGPALEALQRSCEEAKNASNPEMEFRAFLKVSKAFEAITTAQDYVKEYLESLTGAGAVKFNVSNQHPHRNAESEANDVYNGLDELQKIFDPDAREQIADARQRLGIAVTETRALAQGARKGWVNKASAGPTTDEHLSI